MSRSAPTPEHVDDGVAEGGADLVVEILLIQGAANLADLVGLRVHGDDGPAPERLRAALAEPRHGLAVRPHAIVGELHECVEARVVSVDVECHRCLLLIG